MKKCKNVECDNLVEETRTYCSLKCRNIFVNKNLRDYTKNGKAISNKFKNKYEIKYCKECKIEISYEKRINEFCSHECSAKFNNKNREVVYKDGVKEKLKELAYINFFNNNKDGIELVKKSKQENYEKNPLFCLCCEQKISYSEYLKKKNRKYCSFVCSRKQRTINDNKTRTQKEIYKSECQFKFALSDFAEEFDFNLIKENGWYKAKNRGNNLNGVSRDHLFSISEGFKQNVSAELISHPANCKLVLHSKNQKKNTKCDITLVELMERIEKWNKKYMPA